MDVHCSWELKKKFFYSHFLLKYYLFVFFFLLFSFSLSFRTLNSHLSLSTLSALSQLPLTIASLPPRCQPTPPAHAADPCRRSTLPTHLALTWFFFFFSPAVGCGVVVVVVVWVDRRRWVTGFVGISGLWLGSSASVGGLGGFRGG